MATKQATELERSAEKRSAEAELGRSLPAAGSGTRERTRAMKQPMWEQALLVHQIPLDILPMCEARDTLCVLAALQEVEIYQAVGGRWNLWFEAPIRERVSVLEWVARVSRRQQA
jgi:hypothetical protein